MVCSEADAGGCGSSARRRRKGVSRAARRVSYSCRVGGTNQLNVPLSCGQGNNLAGANSRCRSQFKMFPGSGPLGWLTNPIRGGALQGANRWPGQAAAFRIGEWKWWWW